MKFERSSVRISGMSGVTRRDFLRLSTLALGGLAFSRYSRSMVRQGAAAQGGLFDDGNLVRVATDSVSVYSEPNDTSQIVSQWFRDELVNYYEEVNSGTPGYNPVWYRVWGGYMHRAHLQKVKFLYNEPLSIIRDNGQLGQVTVPYSPLVRYVKSTGWTSMVERLYYDSVHWIVGLDEGPDGQPWYRLLDELLDTTYNTPASSLRPIADDEIAPISPEVPYEGKRIEVSLATQVLTCYEYDKVVLKTQVSTGIPSRFVGPTGLSTTTPAGNWKVEVKMPSKHMGQGNLAADVSDYYLLGVPWCSFFTEQGHAFHGAWWHDNFGVPMSHGCINMRPEEAKWLFRWTLPAAAAADINPRTLDRKGFGTKVIVT
jgi:lipoprotein-anchoring transpeptidase ErfK/SrfK